MVLDSAGWSANARATCVWVEWSLQLGVELNNACVCLCGKHKAHLTVAVVGVEQEEVKLKVHLLLQQHTQPPSVHRPRLPPAADGKW
jgi:hypothetical protein